MGNLDNGQKSGKARLNRLEKTCNSMQIDFPKTKSKFEIALNRKRVHVRYHYPEKIDMSGNYI